MHTQTHIHIHTHTHTHTYTHTQVTTTLVSMCDRSTVDKNTEAAKCPLTLKEQLFLMKL